MIALVVPEILPPPELANLELDITEEEILADLSWPGPPPGHTELPVSETEVCLG